MPTANRRTTHALPQPRNIKPETICIGDTIRVTHTHKDVTKSVVGTVGNRNVYGHSTEYATAEGVVLYTHYRYIPDKGYSIVLLERVALSTLTPLTGLDDI